MSNRILLAHGSGGRLAQELVSNSFVKKLHNPLLDKLNDAAVFSLSGRLAFTTDSYVVSPLFFPGGDIGKLAICGTINDLATSGAQPRYLSLSFIIEEGFTLDELEKIVASIKKVTEEAEVDIVTGDTKVVNRGSADKLFINTSGIGVIPEGVNISGDNARKGDRIILSGSLGDHGIAVLSKREGLSFTTQLESDCAPLAQMIAEMLKVCPDIHCLRDPTRGGLATTLNELAAQSEVGIQIEERSLPVREEVLGACEMLGIDPLYVANEGKLVVIVPAAAADDTLSAIKRSPYGEKAAIIGEVTDQHPGRVVMKTSLGTSRIIDMLVGDPLPRIC